MLTLSYFEKGTIPHALLYRLAVGARVRSALLKEAWTAGKTGSILALNGPSRFMCAQYFKEADPEFLMDENEHSKLKSLGKIVRIYRGARLTHGCHRKAAYALSWSLDYATARRFGVHGHGNAQGVVLAADLPKDAVLALWETSGREEEVVVDPRRLRNIHINEMIDPAEEMAAWA